LSSEAWYRQVLFDRAGAAAKLASQERLEVAMALTGRKDVRSLDGDLAIGRV
jgi:hypothetical protein